MEACEFVCRLDHDGQFADFLPTDKKQEAATFFAPRRNP